MNKAGIFLSLLFLLTVLACYPAAAGHSYEKLVPDPNLERTIRQHLNKPTGEITVSDLESLEMLFIKHDLLDPSLFPEGPPCMTPVFRSPYAVNDLTGLEHAINLSFLYIGESGVSDLSPVSELPLTQVILSLTDVQDISPLSGISSLTSLTALYNNINFDNLTGFENLDTLWICGEEVTDLSAISELTNLKLFRICLSSVADLSPLAGHPSLASLEVPGNYLREIDTLLEIPNLEIVFIDYNFIIIEDDSRASDVIDELIGRGVHVDMDEGQLVYPVSLSEGNSYSQLIDLHDWQESDDVALKIESSESFEGHIMFAIRNYPFNHPDVDYLSEEFSFSTRYNLWGYLYMEMSPEEPDNLIISELEIPIMKAYKEYVTEDMKVVDEKGLRLHYYNEDLQPLRRLSMLVSN